MKYQMLQNWQEEGEKGPLKGEIVDLSTAKEVFDDDDGFFELWFFEYKGEFFELYPYEVEKV